MPTVTPVTVPVLVVYPLFSTKVFTAFGLAVLVSEVASALISVDIAGTVGITPLAKSVAGMPVEGLAYFPFQAVISVEEIPAAADAENMGSDSVKEVRKVLPFVRVIVCPLTLMSVTALPAPVVEPLLREVSDVITVPRSA